MTTVKLFTVLSAMSPDERSDLFYALAARDELVASA